MAIYQYLTMSFQRAEMYKSSKSMTLPFPGYSEKEPLVDQKCEKQYESTSETAANSSQERSKLLSSQQEPTELGKVSGVVKS